MSRAAGPTWTRARLQRVMALRFGTTSRGHLDVKAVAGEMGVTPRSVQRWLHAAHGRSLAHIPPKRLKQLLELLVPDQDVLLDEAKKGRYAARAIKDLELGRKMGTNPAWEKQRWLEQHLVVVLEIKVNGHKIRQVAVTRADVAKIEQLKKRGTVVDQAVVPTKFHATVLIHRVLTDMGPWRFRALPGQVAQGYTQAWLDDAPTTNLGATFHDLTESGAISA